MANLLNSSFKTNFQISDFLLFMTAAFIAATTYETRKMRVQARETELRPIILRQGYIKSWSALKFSFNKNGGLQSGNLIEFKVVKGIATNIKGYIVIDNKKYDLHLGCDVSKIAENSYAFLKRWGWLGTDASIFALYLDSEGKHAFGKNRIYLSYRNIEGKEYYTVEYDDFYQESLAF